MLRHIVRHCSIVRSSNSIQSRFAIPPQLTRTLSTSTDPIKTSENENNDNTSTNGLVNQLNNAFTNYPRDSIASLMAFEIGTIFATHQLILLSGVHVPVEFGVAFAMARPFRRMRLPVEIAGAAALTKLMPSITQVQLTRLLGAAPSKLRIWFNTTFKSKPVVAKAETIAQKYGAAYLISARWVGVGVVCSLYTGLTLGFDVASFLESIGIHEYGSAISEWAAAVALSSFLYPCTIIGGGLVAPHLNGIRSSIMK